MAKQTTLGIGEKKQGAKAVECLGMTFESDAARRAHFTEILRQKLADPAFRVTPGFPKATDEAILRVSDPPYYTACPNPFLAELVLQLSGSASPDPYHRTPFVTDVAEGKNDPIYNAHSYHTKVPPRAIRRYIEHYTRPGDLVLDIFCGTGMTGVSSTFAPPRATILCDISPAATNIAYGYVADKDFAASAQYCSKVFDGLNERFSWMFRTAHTGWPSSDRRVRTTSSENPGVAREGVAGDIQFTLWSDVFGCPHCQREIVFWHHAVDQEGAGIRDEAPCAGCGAVVGKSSLVRLWEALLDPELRTPVRRVKRAPVLIQYEFEGKVYHKVPDRADIDLLFRQAGTAIPERVPTTPLPEGDKTGDPRSVGITHAHHFYSRRNLAVLAALHEHVSNVSTPHRAALGFLFSSTLPWSTWMNRLLVSNFFLKRGGVIGQTLSGTLYVSSVSVETNVLYRLRHRLKSAAETVASRSVFITTQSATSLSQVPDSCIDYIFTDPPFGHNLIYSDLNFLWESWLGLHTETRHEAIVSAAQRKTVDDYRALMEAAFAEAYRVLKPNRWITVEFHNSKNAVWQSIQTALGRAGFVVAGVSIIEKTHNSFNQVTAAGAVKKDLAITAYKPSQGLTQRFELATGTHDDVWAFVREHLRNVPVVAEGEGDIEVIAERTAQTLYDRVIAFFVQHGATVPISAPEFFEGLDQRFARRDGMHFLPDQVSVYDKKRALGGNVRQLSLFVMDEATAIRWLRQALDHKPQSFQDLQPQFMKAAGSWAKHERTVELKDLLRENFLHYDGAGEVPAPIHSYLSTNLKLRNLDKLHPELREAGRDRWYVPSVHRLGDLEQLRLRALLREFEEYKMSTQRKIKQFRTEAVRAGFKAAYDAKDYRTIVEVAAKLPDEVVQEDEKLLMYVDVATMRYDADQPPTLFPQR